MLPLRLEHHLCLDPKQCLGTTLGKNYSIHKRGVVGWEVEKKLNDGTRTKPLVSKFYRYSTFKNIVNSDGSKRYNGHSSS